MSQRYHPPVGRQPHLNFRADCLLSHIYAQFSFPCLREGQDVAKLLPIIAQAANMQRVKVQRHPQHYEQDAMFVIVEITAD